MDERQAGYRGECTGGMRHWKGARFVMTNLWLRYGSGLMVLGALGFLIYGLVFFLRSFSGPGFELGVATLNGLTPADLEAFSPAVMHYIRHLHVAVSEFIMATGIAVAALAGFGVRRGQWWAWIAAVAAPVVGLVVVVPMHYAERFTYDHVTHLGPIYLATLVFLIGAVMAVRGLTATDSRTETSA